MAEMCSTGANFRNASRSRSSAQGLALVVVDRVPLVDGHHHRAAAFQDVAGDVGVLLADALGGVDQQQHHVGVGNGLQRLDHRELLDRLEHLALAAQAGGVDQFERLPSRSNGT
jgi:hypothetical protein